MLVYGSETKIKKRLYQRQPFSLVFLLKTNEIDRDSQSTKAYKTQNQKTGALLGSIRLKFRLFASYILAVRERPPKRE